MVGRLDGKVCILTGTGGGIGKAAALMFAREGAKIVGCEINIEAGEATDAEVCLAGGKMVSVQPCDLSKPEDCHRLVDLAIATYGRIDVLFHNAGQVRFGWIEDLSYEDWKITIDSELDMVFLLNKTIWPEMAKHGGSIINTASTAGWITFEPLGGIAHSAAKAGVIGMTRHLAMEGRKCGIRANTVSPGVVMTPRNSHQFQNHEWSQQMVRKILRGTPGQPEEIAAVGLFLASDESSFVNGADIIADGGMTIW